MKTKISKTTLTMIFFLFLITFSECSNIKFHAEFPSEHPFAKVEMWHPHLKKSFQNENFIIEDSLRKVYPTQLMQLKSSKMRRSNSPKLSCGCKFINSIQSTTSLIQTPPKAEKESFVNNRLNSRINRNSNPNLNNNFIQQQQIQSINPFQYPNQQNLNSLIYGNQNPILYGFNSQMVNPLINTNMNGINVGMNRMAYPQLFPNIAMNSNFVGNSPGFQFQGIPQQALQNQYMYQNFPQNLVANQNMIPQVQTPQPTPQQLQQLMSYNLAKERLLQQLMMTNGGAQTPYNLQPTINQFPIQNQPSY